MAMTCGICKEQNVTIAHVQACSGIAPKPEEPIFSDNPEPAKKMSFRVGKPVGQEKPGPIQEEDRVYLKVPFSEKNDVKRKFGGQWDAQKRQWFVDKSADFDEMPPEWLAEKPLEVAIVLEDGIYRLPHQKREGGLFMVYHTQQDIQVAKELVFRDEDGEITTEPLIQVSKTDEGVTYNSGDAIGEWEYVGKGPLSRLTPEMLLNEEDAARFGQVYGWCGKCGRVLRNEESKAAGIGPVCAGKE